MLDPYSRIAVRELLGNLKSSLIRWGRLTRSSADGYATMDNRGAGAADARDVRIAQHYGFRSRMRPGGEVYAAAVSGGSANLATFATEQPGSGPTDQADDDVELYSDHGQRVRLGSDKHLKLDAPSPSDVVVNGGGKKVARVDDGIWASDLRVEVTSDGGMPPKDVITISVISLDPQDPAYLSPIQLVKFKVSQGDAQFPPMGVPFQTRLRGVIVRGADRFKA